MQRLLLLGAVFVSTSALQAEIHTDSKTALQDKESAFDLPIDAVIANEAIEDLEMEKEDAVAAEVEESENLDIDSLILEAENALKDEGIEEPPPISSSDKRVMIQYDDDDEAVIAVKKNSPSPERIAVEDSSGSPKKNEPESVARIETVGKRVLIQYDEEQDAAIETRHLPQMEKKTEEILDPLSPAFTLEEVALDFAAEKKALSQDPFIEITIDEPFVMEPSIDLPDAAAESVNSSSIEINKGDLEKTSPNEMSSLPFFPEQSPIQEAPASVNETPFIQSRPQIPQEQSVFSPPRAQIKESDLPKRTSLSSLSTTQQQETIAPVSLESDKKSKINIQEVFSGSPVVYMLLLLLSVATIALFLYNFFYLRVSELVPKNKVRELKSKIQQQEYLEAKALCLHQESFFFKMLVSGLSLKEQPLPDIIEAMKNEGKKHTSSFWQKLSLLNDIAIIAPMVGLLGTVLGMFYAFYDIQQSAKNISSLFDGLGISVGTTVAGLGVAILAMILHSISKYRLMKVLVYADTQSEQIAHLIKGSTLQNPSNPGLIDDSNPR